MKGPAVILMALASVAVSTSLQAQGWSRFLKDTPLSHFTDADLSLFEAARVEALESRPDGSPVGWNNPDTGASGSVTPVETNRSGGNECRLLRVINHAGGQTGDSRFWFCKMPDGSWKSTSSGGGSRP